MEQEPTEEQLEIINHKDGHLLVLAGPGSGKTFVLVERVKKLVESEVKPEEILCITFTDKGTEEMSQRLEKMGNTETKVSTFHSFCKQICEDNMIESGISIDSKLIKEESVKVWALKNSDSFDIDGSVIPFQKDNAGLFAGMNSAITNFKESLITSDELQTWLEEKVGEIEKMSDEEKGKLENMEFIKYVQYHLEFNKVYSAYEKFQEENSLYDFSDIIKKTTEMFKRNSLILESYKKKYKYILVDEFQDNNFSQYELIRLLGEGGNVMVVGDDDQLIMRFQGARESNFTEFRDNFPNVTEKHLTQNFRSTKQIVTFANLFTDKILNRIDKTNTASREGDKVKIVRPNIETAQIEYVVKTIKELYGQEYVNKDGKTKKYGWGDFAILSRKRNDGRNFVDALKTFDIPSTYRGDYNIFESGIVSEVLHYIHIIQSPATAGMYLYKFMTISGIDSANIQLIIEEANRRKWDESTSRGDVDEVFEIMKDCDKLENLTQKQEIKEVVQIIEKAIAEAAKGTVAETVYKIIYTDLSGIYKRCSMHDSAENRLNILMLNKFYELTLEFENLYPGKTLQEFDEYVKYLRKVEIDLEETSVLDDTVQVMTMHKAKGKEYPVVFITDITQYKFPGNDVKREFYVRDGITGNQVSLNFNAATKAFDDKRLLYVACTRAENSLHILSPRKYKKGEAGGRKVSKYLIEVKHDDANKKDFIDISDYNADETIAQSPSEIHERIKNDVQGQLVDSVSKMQISTALARIIELARIKYYQEHREDDPTCSGFNVADVLSIDEKDLNFQDLQGAKKPLFDHDSLSVSKSGLTVYMQCPYKYKHEKILRTPVTGSSIPFDLGTSVHDTIDALTKDDPDNIPTKENAMEKLKEKWVFKSYSSKNESQAHANRAETMIDNYLNWRKNTKNKVRVTEQKFSFDYEGVKVTGSIDWVEENSSGDLEVVDFKSGENLPSGEKWYDDPQLYIYARGVKETKELGKYPVKGSLYYFEIEGWKSLDLDEQKVAVFFENKIKPMLEDILDEKFEPKPGFHCGYCSYLDICEAGQNRQNL